MLHRNTKFKPIYKKFINLRENLLNKLKILGFKKKKWEKFIEFYQRKLKWYKKFKPQNQDIYIVSKRLNRHHAYKKNYRNTLQAAKSFKVFMGNLRKKYLKGLVFSNKFKKTKNKNLYFIESIERRLDIVLYRSKFCHSIRNAQRFITQGNVLVNKKITKSISYILKKGDLISIRDEYSMLVEENIRRAVIWPIPPKHLVINYKTMQILFGEVKHTNTSTLFLFSLNLEKILVNFKRQ